jgi:hypothetical protein
MTRLIHLELFTDFFNKIGPRAYSNAFDKMDQASASESFSAITSSTVECQSVFSIP